MCLHIWAQQCGWSSREAWPAETHLVREKQPEQWGRSPPADGETVPPHRSQVQTQTYIISHIVMGNVVQNPFYGQVKRNPTVSSEILLSARRYGGVCCRIWSTCSRTCTPVWRQGRVTRYETTATPHNHIWAKGEELLPYCPQDSSNLFLSGFKYSPLNTFSAGLCGVPAVFQPRGEHTPGGAAHALLQGTSNIPLESTSEFKNTLSVWFSTFFF